MKELYDKNNPDHNNSKLYKIVEYETICTGATNGASIETDAKRRDFTVNALYFNAATFKLKDPNAQGIDDILTRTLKFVGSPKERIIEDPLRVMRFYRFIKKGLTPDPKSLRAVRENFEYSVKHTNAERIKNEIERIVL